MGVKKILQRKTKSAIIVLAGFLVSFLGLVSASQLSIGAPTTIYQSCIQPYTIMMNTNGIATKSVDTKLLLTGYFSISTPYTTVADAIVTATGYAKYIPGYFNVTTLQTGTATSGINNNRQYFYINSYQLGLNASVTGNNIKLATLYLQASNLTTGYLNFYSITGWNGDDTNISSGINEGIIPGSYTQYVDSLDTIVNLQQTINGSINSCTSRPYISSAEYRQTGYISTATGVQAVWTSVVAGPLYSGTSNRTVWTKGNVKLVLTGISDSYAGAGGLVADNLSTGVQVTHVQAYVDPYISHITNSTGWFTQYHEVGISGNVSTGFVGFDNIIGNQGSTYLTGGQKYTDTFNIDVFWVDRISPVNTGYFTGYIAGTGVGVTNYTLSGSNFVGAGLHATWTTMDDEYKILSFSGNNSVTQDCTDKGYACTNVGYMDYLNSTGYVRSGNNIFKLIHNLQFTTSFSGYVTVIDRAGNTGEWYINVNMDQLIVVNYGLIAYPQSMGSRDPILSGMLIKLAIYSGGFDKTHLSNNLIYTGFVKTSNTGWAGFTGNFASGQYRVLAEGVNTLSYLLSGVQLSPVGGTIDYTQTYTGGFLFGDLNNILTMGSINYANYNYSSIREQIINVADLATLISIWAVWNAGNYEGATPEVGVYTGNLFVDIPNSNRINTYNNLLSFDNNQKYMQYHPYDLDSNGQVNILDYNLAYSNLNKTGVTFGGALNGTTPASMPF